MLIAKRLVIETRNSAGVYEPTVREFISDVEAEMTSWLVGKGAPTPVRVHVEITVEEEVE